MRKGKNSKRNKKENYLGRKTKNSKLDHSNSEIKPDDKDKISDKKEKGAKDINDNKDDIKDFDNENEKENEDYNEVEEIDYSEEERLWLLDKKRVIEHVTRGIKVSF